MSRFITLAALAVICVLPAAAAAAGTGEPRLVGRALLPADATWPAPFAGASNAEPVDAPGARQPVGGFSALLRAPGAGNFLAMPDNGFGTKANSRSFLLRLYRVHADFETARGGAGTVRIPRAITLRDPDHEIPFASSNGFEGMALSEDGRTLPPTLEGPVAGDDPSVRRMYEFDVRRGRYTDVRRTYRVADPALLVSDVTALDDDRLVALERDNGQGAAALHKRAYVVDLDATSAGGAVAEREVADLLALADPHGISLPGRPGDIGLGNPFSMPYVTIEAVLPLGDRRLAIVNDTNFGSMGRNPALPDDSDVIVVRVPGLNPG